MERNDGGRNGGKVKPRPKTLILCDKVEWQLLTIRILVKFLRSQCRTGMSLSIKLVNSYFFFSDNCKWQLLFKAVKGNSRNVYKDFIDAVPLNENDPEAMIIESNKLPFISPLLKDWNKLVIKEVWNLGQGLKTRAVSYLIGS